MIARLIMGVERHVTCRSCINACSSSILHRCAHFTEYEPELGRNVLYLRQTLRNERVLPSPRNNYLKRDYLVKILCPSVVTELMPEYGKIWLNQIIRYSGATIEISQDGEHFPFTEDRVISISGSYESIRKAVEVLVQEMIKPPHNPMTRGRYPQPVQIPQYIRILIPRECCDSVIGQDGAHIVEITYRSKCDAQLEVYNKASKSQERIITVRTLYDTHGLIYAAQLIVWRILNESDAFPYLVKGVTYGNGRYERARYERPDVGNLTPITPINPEKDYDPFLKNLIMQSKNKTKKIYTMKKKTDERESIIIPE